MQTKETVAQELDHIEQQNERRTTVDRQFRINAAARGRAEVESYLTRAGRRFDSTAWR